MSPVLDPDFRAMAEQLFGDLAAARGEQATGLDRDLWAHLETLGLTLLTTPEKKGGSGAALTEAFTLHRTAAKHGIALPLGEHDLLGRWLAARLGWEVGADLLSVGVATRGTTVDVPWGAEVDTVLVAEVRAGRARVSRYRSQELTWSARGRLPGQARARTSLPAAIEAVELDTDVVEQLRLRGALLRSMQIVGALERCVDLAVEHARVRIQFGRPLLAFQAIQEHIAEAAAEVALARAATLAALERPDAARIAVAKSCASHAVGPVTRRAHQVHGAIGTTREHDLHRYSLPALAWRDEFGTGSDWDSSLGTAIDDRGLRALWQGFVEVPADD